MLTHDGAVVDGVEEGGEQEKRTERLFREYFVFEIPVPVPGGTAIGVLVVRRVVNKRMSLGCRKNPPLRPIPARVLQRSAPAACRREGLTFQGLSTGHCYRLSISSSPGSPFLPELSIATSTTPQESDFTLPVLRLRSQRRCFSNQPPSWPATANLLCPGNSSHFGSNPYLSLFFSTPHSSLSASSCTLIDVVSPFLPYLPDSVKSTSSTFTIMTEPENFEEDLFDDLYVSGPSIRHSLVPNC